MAPLYENRNREETFLARPQAGRALSPSYAKPDFSSLLSDGLNNRHLDDGKDLDAYSRAGAELIRSQSAAPAFHGRSPLFPPPGLADIKESQPTPSTVDSYSSSHSGAGNNYESAVDRGADIMKLGQRRPASTGVIGSSGLYAPSGNRAGTFMDLIQEDELPDNPRGSNGSQQLQRQQQQQHQLQDNNFDSYRDARPNQMSPPLRPGSGGDQQQYMYAQQHLQHQPPQQQQQHQYMTNGDPHNDRMQPQPGMRLVRDPYDMGAPMVRYPLGKHA